MSYRSDDPIKLPAAETEVQLYVSQRPPSLLDTVLKVLGCIALALSIIALTVGLYYGIKARNAAVRAGDALQQSMEAVGDGMDTNTREFCEDVPPAGEWIDGECVYADHDH